MISAVESLLAGRTHHVACARSDDLMAALPDGYVNLAILDIPYFGVFAPISREHYDLLQRATCGFARPYDALYRPFTVSAATPFTDVWTYPTVAAYEGKHPCEKPAEMAADIISASSRPGDIVADFYCGSGIFLAEAVKAGRLAVGGDLSEHWADVARRRCEMAVATGQTRIRRIEKPIAAQRSLFDEGGAP